ncbi:MAG: mechanosensitive ion channel family protein [Actinomycetia bacterium]|nr:mechanosensitive ion channel family protein [Actinomycetes bacterium]
MSDAVGEIWSGWGFEISATVGVILVAVILVLVVRRAAARWTNRIDRRLGASNETHDRERGQRLATLADVGRLIASLVIWMIVIVTIMGIWGIPMAPFVAIGATLGLAVGFGAQDAVRDVIAGFLILLEDQYAIGDVVAIAGVSGTVETITLRTTVLRDLSGYAHHVPNGQIKVASNKTADFARYVADIPVAYDVDVDRAMAVIQDEAIAMSSDPDWSGAFLSDPEMLGVDELGDSAVIIRLLMTVATEQRWAVKREFLRRIKIRLDADGIEIPYAYMNVIVRNAGTDPDTGSGHFSSSER